MVQGKNVGRRGFLARMAAASAAGAGAASASGAANAAPQGADENGPPSQLSRSDRAFLEHGLIHAAWVRSGSEDGWFPGTQLWKDSGFTTPHFYGEQTAESALGYVEYSEEVMRGPNKKTWSLANTEASDLRIEVEGPDPVIEAVIVHDAAGAPVPALPGDYRASTEEPEV